MITEKGLHATLAVASNLITAAESSNCVLALDDGGEIELPPSGISNGDQAQLKSVSALYLTAQLENVLLLPCVDLLCGLAMTGAIRIESSYAVRLINDFWQGRNDRFTQTERRAIFGRLFGETDADQEALSSGNNTQFEYLFIDLCEALYKLDEGAVTNYGRPFQQTRVRTAALQLVDNVLHHSGSMAAFAGREVLFTLRTAIAILSNPSVGQAFGRRTLWDVVQVIASKYLHQEPMVTPYITRGKSGMVILSWLADSVSILSGTEQPLLGLDHPVILAAAEWLQASLTISQNSAKVLPVGA